MLEYYVMKSTIKKELTEQFTDCWTGFLLFPMTAARFAALSRRTCGAEDESLGIYLLPGEDKVHDRNDSWLTWSAEPAEDYEFPESWTGKVYFVRRKTPPVCPREKKTDAVQNLSVNTSS